MNEEKQKEGSTNSVGGEVKEEPKATLEKTSLEESKTKPEEKAPEKSIQSAQAGEKTKEEKKKSGWWKWLIAGCGVLLLLAVLGIGGCAILGWKASQTAQDEIEKAQRELEEQVPGWEQELKDAEEKFKETQKEFEKEVEDKNKEYEDELDKLEKEAEDAENKPSAQADIEGTNCDFTKSVILKETTKYGIFGDDEFDTVVCGYLVTKEEIVWDEKQTNAYFVITKYKDEGFKKSLSDGIADGNAVNTMIDGKYAINLGCVENSKIIGMEYEPGSTYIDNATQDKILDSSLNNQASLIVSFGKHEGRGCACCNLAHKLRLY